MIKFTTGVLRQKMAGILTAGINDPYIMVKGRQFATDRELGGILTTGWINGGY